MLPRLGRGRAASFERGCLTLSCPPLYRPYAARSHLYHAPQFAPSPAPAVHVLYFPFPLSLRYRRCRLFCALPRVFVVAEGLRPRLRSAQPRAALAMTWAGGRASCEDVPAMYYFSDGENEAHMITIVDDFLISETNGYDIRGGRAHTQAVA